MVIDLLEDHGAEIVEVSVPLTKFVLPYHYSLIPSEAASNLARFDGVRYGQKIDPNLSKDDSELSAFFQ